VLGLEGEALLIRLDLRGFAVSTGSACASGVVEPSPALLSMGMSPEEALSSLRISFGMTNTPAEVDDFLAVFEGEAAALRQVAPLLR
jgi:cysteine desulfurase